MPLELSRLGQPSQGLFLFGRLPEPKKDAPPASEPGPASPPGADRHRSNPYAEAIQKSEALERQLRLIGTLKPEPSRKGLGAHVDVCA